MAHFDQTLAATLQGYTWLPDLRRRSGGRPVPMRILGQHAIGIGGPDAAAFFYAEGNVERHTALPGFVVRTLFGQGAVHTLDGMHHRHRKALFVSLLTDAGGIDELARIAGERFDRAAERWRDVPEISLFDEVAAVLSAAVTQWTGMPEAESDQAADLVAMVDAFASPGARHVRGLLARRRQERRLAEKIIAVRREPANPTPFSTIAHFEEDGRPLDPGTAAVELLNVLRPATAVAWLVAFAAHALDRWPAHREPLRDGDDAFTRAFVQEVRRFYPFTPYLGGRAARHLRFLGEQVPAGTLVLLDVYGQHHDERVWPQPYEFRPQRFVDRPVGEFELIPQGGGDPVTGHRCPGEDATIALLGTLSQRLARLSYYLPPQDLEIDLGRIPARPRSGVRIVVPADSPALAGA